MKRWEEEINIREIRRENTRKREGKDKRWKEDIRGDRNSREGEYKIVFWNVADLERE